VSVQVTERRNLYLAEFERNGRSLPAFRDLRKKAISRFGSLGYPTGREEAWRHTDTTALAKTPFRPATGTSNPAQFAGLAKGPLKACQIAFVDGRYAPAFSSLDLPPGVRVMSLAAVLRDDPKRIEPWLARHASFEMSPFTALNTAFMNDGAFLFVPRGITLEAPVHLLFLSSLHGEAYVTHPRILLVLEEDARATVVQSWLGPAGGTYFTNAVTEAVLGDGSRLELTKVQRESQEAFHVEALQVVQGRGSGFTHHSISLGGRLSRNDLGSVLAGEGAECALLGLYEVAHDQQVDHHTTIDHAKPHGTSRELYKGILDGRSRGVFDGRIVVRAGAQKTNAVQSNKNLLLSKEALVHTKPQLEIFANDVKCKHGATIGQLDEAMLFYMRSRGIGAAEARRLLIHAFASEIIDTVKAPAVRSQIGGCLGLLVGGA
jgi:Fe-S cluster assembly protein SufD